MISLSAVLTVVIYLVVAGLIFYLCHWLLGYIGLPEPFNKIARVLLAVFAVLVVCGALISLVSPGPLFRW